MLPPPICPVESDKDSSLIKTPRPDITIGIFHGALNTALQSQGLNDTEAEDLLRALQKQMTCRKGNQESALCSEPTSRPLEIRFPFLIVEGKSHATGKHIFEAQNQAAVSGACALKILHDLDELVDRASQGHSSTEDSRLVFSICTQGPFHELWAHYTVVVNGIRNFHMIPVQACRAPILKGVLEFLVMVDNVMSWGTGEFLDGIVERLGKVATRAVRA